MHPMTLYIGSKSLSSWSLRPWVLMRHHGLAFDEVVITLDVADTAAHIRAHSPTGRVPVLVDGDLRIWESQAICEYVAETFALPRAWPLEPAARAMARAISAEMHAGFESLRRELPFEAQREPGPVPMSAETEADIARIRHLWREARRLYGHDGEWLFGKFGIADAMYVPVAIRFFLYDVPLDGPERDYMHSVILHPAVQAWMEAASQELPGGESALERTQEVESMPEPQAAAEPAAVVETVAAASAPEPTPAVASAATETTSAVPPSPATQPEPPATPAAAPTPAAKPAPAAAIAKAASAINTGAELPKVRSFQLPSD
ncbi:glutathione S-transferase family protein [Solimonas marina]|uniref:Glutathione S-transferase family protein n=1 Tax=Solimonas marina TaxID=2714601 RepID=A0A969W5I0_9GAMM|nr:glutathione S-transferase family protein [Solimonas marina]NKF21056.1 glutathione S-transferase family protein [Solimonas marina]